STIDERLEIDTIGVLHITDHGQLITYPHPVPGLPALPRSGATRNVLCRREDGDYTITDPDSGQIRHFTAPHGVEPGGDGDAWLVQITDRNDNTISIDRTDDGTPTAIVHSAGHRLLLTAADHRVTGLALSGADTAGPVHPLLAYGYTDGNLTSVAKPSGAALTLEYDHRRRVTAWIDSNSRRYGYAYDEQDRCVAEGGEAGHIQLTLAYSIPDPASGNRVTTLTTADGRTTRHLIGPGCRVLATTDPLGHTTRFTYDARGNQLTHTDALGRITAFTYDEEGRLKAVIRPDGAELSTVRGSLGLSTEFTGPDGACWRQEFDERGNRTAVVDPAGHATRYAYDAGGRLTSVTDALGGVTTIRCDPAGRPVEVVDPLGGSTRFVRDDFGRPVRITDPLGAVTRLEWSADGELERRTGPDGSSETWSHDGEGNCVSHVDATGAESRFEYTHFDLLAARTGPDGTRYAFEHDADLRLTRVSDPHGLTWSYFYDPAGRLVSESDFDGRTLRYALDPAGRLTARTTPLGEVVAYEHDELGRVIRQNAAGAVTSYAYDRAGRLLQATGPSGELLYRYDRRGRVTAELSDGHAVTYAYDALGRRTHRTTPTGQTTVYGYDAASRPAHLTSAGRRIAFTWDAAGRELERVFGDTLTLTSTWDEAGRLADQRLTAGDRTLNRRGYDYRADGHLTGITDQLSGDRSFELDPVGRVTAVHAAGWTERYAYDAAGNQSSASWPSSHPGHEATGARSYTGTSITRAGEVRYEHDGGGRIVLRQRTRLSRRPDTWRYEWDAEDRLTAVTTPDGTRWRYLYDPLGRRSAKQRLADDGETVCEETRFTWDGAMLCEQLTTSTELPHPVATTWDHQGLRPLAQTERVLAADSSRTEIDQRFFAIATDLMGTPTELVDETGEVAWRTRTTLWGTTTWNRDATAYTPLRFPGQYFDPETGLHYNVFRHYDPESGRYAAPDPLGLAPAPNPVAYVHNPYTICDPLGLSPYPQFKGLGWLTERMLARPSFRYQRTVTNQDYEQQWILPDGREVHLDGGPRDGWIAEAKWTGGDKQSEWEKSPYNPDHKFYSESKITDQAEKLLALNEGLEGRGVRYMVSNEWGAAHVNEVLARAFPEAVANGTLKAYHVPGTGMSGMSAWLQ
ncbi:RHS repeat-associated core domain-containing protein, partial [Streptomyces sp. NPDC001985]|uniref:RHS repeat-associated core domain-containing protein n=1 Tax=Streptomyces sp. NPDC001985 TaxID=3154406 RepID=UPI003320D20E